MIHYHGLPITPASAAAKVLSGRHAFVSYLNPQQLEIAIEVCQSFAVDNGAFSAWKNFTNFGCKQFFRAQVERRPMGRNFSSVQGIKITHN